MAPYRVLFITAIPSAFILVLLAAAGTNGNIPIDHLTRDVTAIAGIHPLSGALSNLGILLWCVSASVCIFVAVTIRSMASREVLKFLFASAALSAYLLIDDLFLFHEDLAARYFGLSEKFALFLLGLFVLTYLLAFASMILKTNYVLLITAFVFLSTSVLEDQFLSDSSWLGQWEYFLEDGAKWLGISFWCSYYMNTANQMLNETFKNPYYKKAV